MVPSFFMEQTELNYYIQSLQKRLTDYFNQSIVMESKIQYQNDIIKKQNQTISDLDTSVTEYKEQIKNLNAKPTRKKTPPSDKTDGGTF